MADDKFQYLPTGTEAGSPEFKRYVEDSLSDIDIALDTLGSRIGTGGGGDLPAGGTTGDQLEKLSDTDGDAGWVTREHVPGGGSDGQVLTSQSGAPVWEDPSGGGGRPLSAARLLMPADQSIPELSEQRINFAVVDYDQQMDLAETASDGFRIPRDGVYHIVLQTKLDGPAIASYAYFSKIYTDNNFLNTLSSGSYDLTKGTAGGTINFEGNLTANTLVQASVLKDSASASDTLDATVTWFSCHEVIGDISGGGGGVTDHGQLTGLLDDDHPQYLTEARGDARYLQLTDAPKAEVRVGMVSASAISRIGPQSAIQFISHQFRNSGLKHFTFRDASHGGLGFKNINDTVNFTKWNGRTAQQYLVDFDPHILLCMLGANDFGNPSMVGQANSFFSQFPNALIIYCRERASDVVHYTTATTIKNKHALPFIMATSQRAEEAGQISELDLDVTMNSLGQIGNANLLIQYEQDCDDIANLAVVDETAVIDYWKLCRMGLTADDLHPDDTNQHLVAGHVIWNFRTGWNSIAAQYPEVRDLLNTGFVPDLGIDAFFAASFKEVADGWDIKTEQDIIDEAGYHEFVQWARGLEHDWSLDEYYWWSRPREQTLFLNSFSGDAAGDPYPTVHCRQLRKGWGISYKAWTAAKGEPSIWTDLNAAGNTDIVPTISFKLTDDLFQDTPQGERIFVKLCILDPSTGNRGIIHQDYIDRPSVNVLEVAQATGEDQTVGVSTSLSVLDTIDTVDISDPYMVFDTGAGTLTFNRPGEYHFHRAVQFSLSVSGNRTLYGQWYVDGSPVGIIRETDVRDANAFLLEDLFITVAEADVPLVVDYRVYLSAASGTLTSSTDTWHVWTTRD